MEQISITGLLSPSYHSVEFLLCSNNGMEEKINRNRSEEAPHKLITTIYLFLLEWNSLDRFKVKLKLSVAADYTIWK